MIESKRSLPKLPTREALLSRGAQALRVGPGRPQVVVFVIDVSESMEGQPITDATAACLGAAQELAAPTSAPFFCAALITYADDARVAVPVARITDFRLPGALPTTGYTNVTSALALAKSVAQEPLPIPGSALRPVAVLLTDGRHNRGTPPGPALLTELKAVADVVAVGFGPDADMDLLSRIATGPEFARRAISGAELRGFFASVAATMSKSRAAGASLAVSGLAPFGSRAK